MTAAATPATFRRFSLGVGCLIFALGLQGCMTTKKGVRSVDVRVTSGSVITVEDSHVPLPNLSGKLKRMGATKHTRVMLLIHQGSVPGIAKMIMQHLVKHGFPKVVIVKKRRPRIYMKPSK